MQLIKFTKLSILMILVVVNISALSSAVGQSQDDDITFKTASPRKSDGDVRIIVDTLHKPIVKLSTFTDFTGTLNNTFDNTGNIIGMGTSFLLNDTSGINYDILLSIAPTTNFTTVEQATLRHFIDRGGSVFIATAAHDACANSLNTILNPMGINLDSNLFYDPQFPGLNRTDFVVSAINSPSTPLTENITEVAFANSTSMTIDLSLINNDKAGAEIKDVYSIFRATDGNILGVAVEFKNHARVVVTSSINMFNNTYMDPISTPISLFLDNTEFVLSAMRWLGRITGTLAFKESSMNFKNRLINEGTVISINCTVEESVTNQTLESVKVTAYFERTGHIYHGVTLGLQNTTYASTISTATLTPGWISIHIEANRRGYYIDDIIIGQVFINYPSHLPIPTNFVILLIFAIVVLICGITTALQWSIASSKKTLAKKAE